MVRAIQHLAAGSRALGYLLGGVALALAFAVAATARDVPDIAGWALGVFGPVFMLLLAGLVFIAILGLVRIADAPPAQRRSWFETGMQAASGVATLALTYTLLGISLGIGSLAGQELTPATVQDVIRELTANFSTAFMTTVIGLPVSAVLRALLMVAYTRSTEGRELSSPDGI